MIALIAGLMGGSLGASTYTYAASLALVVAILAGCVSARPGRVLFWFVAGIGWGLWNQPPSPDELPVDPPAAVTVDGWIESLPRLDRGSARLIVRVAGIIDGNGEHHPWRGRLWLTWDNYPERLQVGDRWELPVRLRAPYGRSNPGGFDRLAWLRRQGLAGEASVVTTGEVRLRSPSDRFAPGRWRQRVADRVGDLADGRREASAIIRALAVGDRQFMSDTQWQVLAATGTSHLMAISGLHLGLVAGFGYVAVAAFWGLIPAFRSRLDRRRAGIPAGLLAAGVYAVLAGFTLPTQRALLMLSVGALALLVRRPVQPLRILAVALVLVLLLDPAAPRTAGFWLSFGAVTLIFLHLGAHRKRSGAGAAIDLQILLGVGLIPLTVWFFQQAPWVSPLANLIAIPWVGFTTVPLILLALLSAPFNEALAGTLLHLATISLEGLWPILEGMAHARFSSSDLARPSLLALLAGLAAVLLWTVPAAITLRAAASLALLPLLWPATTDIAAGGFRATALDVGNGLSVVIETRNHVLLYDTGPAWPGGNSGRSIVVPSLRQLGRTQVDVLVVSHGDGAHRGGLPGVLQGVPVERRLVGDPASVPVRGGEPCLADEEWTWDGVRFTILHPPTGSSTKGDDHSCVLLVRAGSGAGLLLPGDIGPRVERALVDQYGPDLDADVLVAPFQGRRPSSTPRFLDTVRPGFVLFSLAPYNRWGYPRPETVERYGGPGRKIVSTAEHGAISFDFDGEGPVRVRGWRSGVIQEPAAP